MLPSAAPARESHSTFVVLSAAATLTTIVHRPAYPPQLGSMGCGPCLQGAAKIHNSHKFCDTSSRSQVSHCTLCAECCQAHDSLEEIAAETCICKSNKHFHCVMHPACAYSDKDMRRVVDHGEKCDPFAWKGLSKGKAGEQPSNVRNALRSSDAC